jgi:hypothetical protein
LQSYRRTPNRGDAGACADLGAARRTAAASDPVDPSWFTKVAT